MDLEEEIDYYDLINAPQYLDFNELVKNNGELEDEDSADRFFGEININGMFYILQLIQPKYWLYTNSM